MTFFFFLQAFDGQAQTFILQPPGEMLHLKCCVTALEDTKTLIAVDSARAVVDEMNRLTDNYYTAIYVPDLVAANVLSANGVVLIQEGFPRSEQILRDHLTSAQVVALNMSEIIKADGALTCGSILIK
jgi:dimethylargininase